MTKASQSPSLDGLRLSQRLVQDHGDALRLSLSKKGRIWLTFTHWDNEKYNTSVELDGMASVDDLLKAFAVVAVAHYAKCFQGIAHEDSWTGVSATLDLSDAALDFCHARLNGVLDNVEPSGNGAADHTDDAR